MAGSAKAPAGGRAGDPWFLRSTGGIEDHGEYEASCWSWHSSPLGSGPHHTLPAATPASRRTSARQTWPRHRASRRADDGRPDRVAPTMDVCSTVGEFDCEGRTLHCVEAEERDPTTSCASRAAAIRAATGREHGAPPASTSGCRAATRTRSPSSRRRTGRTSTSPPPRRHLPRPGRLRLVPGLRDEQRRHGHVRAASAGGRRKRRLVHAVVDLSHEPNAGNYEAGCWLGTHGWTADEGFEFHDGQCRVLLGVPVLDEYRKAAP